MTLQRRSMLATAVALGTGSWLAGCASSEAAPDTAYVLLDGSRMTTADFKGKVTLVNFWATTCASCVAEMPELVATYNQFKARGYDTMAVAMPIPAEGPSFGVAPSGTCT